MSLKKMVLIFEDLEEFHLYKDVGMVPVSLYEANGIECTILCLKNGEEEIPQEYRGIRIKSFSRCGKSIFKRSFLNKFQKLPLIIYLMINIRKIDVLMLFHLTARTAFYTSFYKFLHPQGMVYVKLDMDEPSLNEILSLENSWEKKKLKRALKMADLISVETQIVYQKLSFGLLGEDILGKLIYLPNGVDNKGINEKNICIKSFSEKENIMITVGRIGTSQKNNDMLLEVLSNLDLKDWKIFFIGPIEENFYEVINGFYNLYPDKKDKVVFTGRLEKREEIYQYFNRAKVFLLTSIRESFAIVLVEAAYFGNYIVSTSVGASFDVTQNGRLGSIVDVNDKNALERELKKIIEREKDLFSYYDNIIAYNRNYFLWENIGKFLFFEMQKRLRSERVLQ
jgi:glycosyltransferase involved in cell wall biosynthesis